MSSCSHVFPCLFLLLSATGFPVTPGARPHALTGLRLPAVGSPYTCFPWRTNWCPSSKCLRSLFPSSFSHSPPFLTSPLSSLVLLTLCYCTPAFFYYIISRTLVLLSHTSDKFPWLLRVCRQTWDLRGRWVVLTVCSETEPVAPCVSFVSPLATEILGNHSCVFHSRSFESSLNLSILTYYKQQHRVHPPPWWSHSCKAT